MGISPKKTARIQGKVISFCVFFRGSRVTPLKMGANIFFYPTLRDPDSPCQRMIGVYNHLSKVCRFHYQSQKGNWIPRATWIPLMFWVVATQICFSFTPYLGKMNPFWRSYFSNGLVQPPTSFFSFLWQHVGKQNPENWHENHLFEIRKLIWTIHLHFLGFKIVIFWGVLGCPRKLVNG